MAAKRPLEDAHSQPSKKAKKGFSVGPDNLPDGTYKRKGTARSKPFSTMLKLTDHSPENQARSHRESQAEERVCQSTRTRTRVEA